MTEMNMRNMTNRVSANIGNRLVMANGATLVRKIKCAMMVNR